MTDEAEPPRKPEARPPEAGADDPWRTMAGLLGRVWLARERPDLSGGFARGPAAPPPSLVTVPREIPARVPPAPLTAPTTDVPSTGGRSPLGGVASFVVDVATAQLPMDPDARPVRARSPVARHHRGIHCRLALPHGVASHNPCQRLPPPA